MYYNPTIYVKNGNSVIAKDVASQLFEKRIVFCAGEVNEALAISTIANLIYLDSISHEMINLYLTGPGGSFSDALTIYDTIKYLKSEVRIICIGLIASADTIILAAAKKGNRFALPNSDLMIHEPSTGMQGNASSIFATTKRMEYVYQKTVKILSETSGQESKVIEEMIKYDRYFSAQEAIEFGFIDSIIEQQGE